jgi:hypothetical protein
MLTEHHTPIGALISQCQQLAEQLFHEPVRVRVELLPSLDGDSWRADVRSSQKPIAAAATLLAAPPARGKRGALQQLLDALHANAEAGRASVEAS